MGGQALVHGIGTFIIETPESALAPFHVRTQQPDSCLGTRPSANTESASAVILGLPASGTVRNKSVLFMSHPG